MSGQIVYLVDYQGISIAKVVFKFNYLKGVELITYKAGKIQELMQSLSTQRVADFLKKADVIGFSLRLIEEDVHWIEYKNSAEYVGLTV